MEFLTRHIRSLLPALLFLLASCASDEAVVVYTPEEPEGEVVSEEAREPDSGTSEIFLRQRILADMLYEARLAYDDNRLMAPAGDNAYEGYRAILDFDPGNEIARQGIRDIALRYIQLANTAIRGRQYDLAEQYLDNATRLEVEGSAITAARNRLAEAREIEMDVFPLDGGQLADRSLDIMVELGEIGEYIREQEAVFLINARTDEEGRWIYKIMREAVGGYRLRGNIAVDSEPSIQVVVPKS